MIKGFLLILATVTVTRAIPAPTCRAAMAAVGLDDYFGTAVAHRVHGLTLEDLRYYFKEDAPVENNIPTVSFDLSPNAKRVLPHAPLIGYDTTFKTIAMRHADGILSNMNNKDWQIKNYSALEKIIHALHMSEMWQEAREYYEGFLDSPPSEEVCSCVREIKENGIMAELELLALKIKFPGLTSGNTDLPYGKNATLLPLPHLAPAYNFGFGYDFRLWKQEDKAGIRRVRRFERKLKAFDFDGDEEEVVDRAMNELQDGDQGLSKHLDGEEGWQAWKKGFNMDSDDNRQFAMFIYCTLNE